MHTLNPSELSRIVEMAWEDRTPFEAIHAQFQLTEPEVKALMRSVLKPSSYRLWRARVTGRQTKHQQLRDPDVQRAYCPTQYKYK
ncbi:TIGR03643 family protein [Polynucleobacter acidiphobus]|uniref:TIGR03643 family protein n=1 Tax=Polynucleobacter acidiphobus TaxID=556053 RepID=UPI000D391715|nr:TIGR03643 family protein [Polynucleobacter acidiphobus]